MRIISRTILGLGLSLGISTSIWADPVATAITATVRPIGSVRTAIRGLSATPTEDYRIQRFGTVESTLKGFRITALPAGGTLYYASAADGPRTAVTSATAMPVALTLAQAANLSFEPGSTAGNFIFTYIAFETNNYNGANSPIYSDPVTYAIPLSATAYPQGGSFDFSSQTNGTSSNTTLWTTRTLTASGVTLTPSAYSASASNPVAEFRIGDNGLATPALFWFTDYSGTGNTSQITYTFSTPVRSLSLVFQDVDAGVDNNNNFIDQLRIDGYTETGTTPVALTAANFKTGNSSTYTGTAFANAYVGTIAAVPNTVTGTAPSAATSTDNVIVTFPATMIKRLTISYRNVAPSGAYSQQWVGLSSMGWAATATGTPLPVGLTRFAATARQADADLSWATATEQNNDAFEIERSTNGSSFERMGMVRGHGTTTSAQSYAYTDKDAAHFGTTLYYRLRQVDVDGTAAYSPVQTVQFEADGYAAVVPYPNPSVGSVGLDLGTLPTGAYSLTVLDATGRVVLSQEVPVGELRPALDLRKLRDGPYLLHLQGKGISQTMHISKQL
ncbi:MAG: hypothetical protein JWP58_3111 [Hymenobacter sp.]|nr:hypothetical protein [Hymenobacter sp.]